MIVESDHLGLSETTDPEAEVRRKKDEEAVEHLDSAFELITVISDQIGRGDSGLVLDLAEAQQHIDAATEYLYARLGLLPHEPTDEELLVENRES